MERFTLIGVEAVSLNLGLRPGDLVEGDLRLGGETQLPWHADLGTALGVLGPGLGQIQAPGDRQAGLLVGYREADGDLAVVLFAELAAVLPRDGRITKQALSASVFVKGVVRCRIRLRL